MKTGTSELELDQVESYLDAARERGFDAVVTISNQIVPGTGEHPVTVNKRKLLKVELHHISWVALLTEAVMERDHRGVADDDQAWILSELIAYLEHGNSGAMLFEDMGQHWTAVRDGARARTLRTRDESVDDVVMRWTSWRGPSACLWAAGSGATSNSCSRGATSETRSGGRHAKPRG